MSEKAKEDFEPIESSTLPLATIGSPAPLVIDLPDGQKLVIGNLDPGTVIEVATWRGTGRPDSRTNRLMLGVSAPEGEAPDEDMHAKKVLHAVKSDVEAELLQENKNSISYTVNSSASVAEQITRTPRLVRKINKKFVVKIVLLSLLTSLLFAGLIGPGKLRVAHPFSGVSSSLGSAAHSLVIFKQGSRGEPGDPVLVDISTADKSPSVAVVTAVDGANYLLATNDGQFQTSSARVRGKVYFVIPYLGALANFIGQ
jgi:hypothetical protein